MDNKNYLDIVRSFKTDNIRIREILDRGLCCCFKHSDEKPSFLLTSINPSFKEDHLKWPHECHCIDVSCLTDGYWKKKINQYGGMWKQISYYDLFPIRETHQYNGFEKAFKNENIFRRNLLEITQTKIEDMAPSLIVHANKGSLYYWGIKKNCPFGKEANDIDNPWMGYKVRRVTAEDYDNLPECMLKYNRLELFPLYEIVGFVDSTERINRFRYKDTALMGSFLMEYVMDDRSKKYNGKLYQEKQDGQENGPKEWTEIWNWVKDHKQ